MLAISPPKDINAIIDIILVEKCTRIHVHKDTADHSAPEGKASAQTPSDPATSAHGHGHGDRGMAENALQAENIPAGHHVVAAKGVPQNVA